MPEYTSMTREQLMDEIAKEILARKVLEADVKMYVSELAKRDAKIVEEHELFLATHRMNLELASRNVAFQNERTKLIATAEAKKDRNKILEGKLETMKKAVALTDRLATEVRSVVDGFGDPRHLTERVRDYLQIRNKPENKDLFE